LVSGGLIDLNPVDRKVESSLSIVQPLLSRNSLLQKKRIAETESEKAYWNYVQTILNASQEIIQGLKLHEVLLNRNKKLIVAGEQSYLASESSDQDYKQGLGDVLDWLSLRRDFLNSEKQIVQNKAEILRNWVSVQVAMGNPINKVIE